MFQTRHFTAIANILNTQAREIVSTHQKEGEDSDHTATHREAYRFMQLCLELEDLFANSNPGFDACRFKKAAGCDLLDFTLGDVVYGYSPELMRLVKPIDLLPE